MAAGQRRFQAVLRTDALFQDEAGAMAHSAGARPPILRRASHPLRLRLEEITLGLDEFRLRGLEFQALADDAGRDVPPAVPSAS